MVTMADRRCMISRNAELNGVGDLRQTRVFPYFRVLATALVLFAALAADLRGRQLLEVDGIELRGTAHLVLPGGGTCNVLESDTSYEERKQHHGAPMDIWRLDFSVHNGSGRWLDHVIARYGIEAEWPECTNWDGPDAGAFPRSVEWASSAGHIQESGRNVVAPGRTLTTTHLFIVLRGAAEPRFLNWSMDFDFAAAPPPADSVTGAAGPPAATRVPSATEEQEIVFWQSIADSRNPVEFEAYLSQFPNGVFRALAEARLAALRERPDETFPLDRPRSVSTTGGQPRPPGWSIDFGDDVGEYSQDGDCDDPRFEGAGMSLAAGVVGMRGRDATDCRRLYGAGRIRLFGVDLGSGDVDFGDDAGVWPRDGKCNDPRFEGGGIDSFTHPDERGHDASDCRRLFDAGDIRLFGVSIGGFR